MVDENAESPAEAHGKDVAGRHHDPAAVADVYRETLREFQRRVAVEQGAVYAPPVGGVEVHIGVVQLAQGSLPEEAAQHKGVFHFGERHNIGQIPVTVGESEDYLGESIAFGVEPPLRPVLRTGGGAVVEEVFDIPEQYRQGVSLRVRRQRQQEGEKCDHSPFHTANMVIFEYICTIIV